MDILNRMSVIWPSAWRALELLTGAKEQLRLGQAAGRFFNRGQHRHRVVIGKDTRLSGYMLEPALTAGFVGAGMDVVLLGPLPTPAIAMLTRSLRADLGVMISASHNPFEDNGIKLFGPVPPLGPDTPAQYLVDLLKDSIAASIVAWAIASPLIASKIGIFSPLGALATIVLMPK